MPDNNLGTTVYLVWVYNKNTPNPQQALKLLTSSSDEAFALLESYDSGLIVYDYMGVEEVKI